MTKYGIMEIETGRFMGCYKTSEFSEGRLSMSANRRLETDDLSFIARFFTARPNPRGEFDHHWDTQGHDPSEFVPVAFTVEPGAPGRTVKKVELPDIAWCKNLSDRTLAKTPDIVMKQYFAEPVTETLKADDMEVFIVSMKEGKRVVEGDFIRIEGIEGTIARVNHVAAKTGDWPRVRHNDDEDAFLVVADKGAQALQKAAQLAEIEVSGPAIRR